MHLREVDLRLVAFLAAGWLSCASHDGSGADGVALDGSPSTDGAGSGMDGETSDAAVPSEAGATDDGASEAADGSGADDSSTGDADASATISCSGAAPSWTADVTPILEQGCAGAEGRCHGATALGPWPYATLVNVHASRDTCPAAGSLVTPGSLEGSYLMNKLTGVGICPGTAQMPLGRSPLPAAEIQTIADWICSGALE